MEHVKEERDRFYRKANIIIQYLMILKLTKRIEDLQGLRNQEEQKSAFVNVLHSGRGCHWFNETV